MPSAPTVVRKKMFGYPVAFVNGNMFAGLHQRSLVLRLGEKERAEFLRQKGSAQFEPMPGRPMKACVTAPSALLEDKAGLRRWLEACLGLWGRAEGEGEEGGKPKSR